MPLRLYGSIVNKIYDEKDIIEMVYIVCCATM